MLVGRCVIRTRRRLVDVCPPFPRRGPSIRVVVVDVDFDVLVTTGYTNTDAKECGAATARRTGKCALGGAPFFALSPYAYCPLIWIST